MIFGGVAALSVQPALVEYGQRFETGRPVELRWLRNTGRAPHFGERFQQHIEPAGKYVLHTSGKHTGPSSHWDTGIVMLESPLVLPFNLVPRGGYDAKSWKCQLADGFGAKKLALSRAVRCADFDAIVTVQLSLRGVPVHTSEIVLLHGIARTAPAYSGPGTASTP